jgi:beta-galactosidase GanA
MSHFALCGSSGFDLYVDGLHWMSFLPPFDCVDGYENVLELGSTEMKEILINFPLYSDVSELYVGLSEGAEVLATYASEYYEGTPAMTVNTYGKGKAYYQTFRDTGAFKDRFIGQIVDELRIARAVPEKMPNDVSAHKRYDGDTTYLFVENYSDKRVADIRLDGTYVDMLTGESCTRVDMEAFHTRIFKKQAKSE